MKVSQFLTAALTVSAIAAISGCGGSSSVPPGDVAVVAGEGISKQTFDRWLKMAAGEKNAEQKQPGQIIVPDPPSYSRCIAAQQRELKAAKSKYKLNQADLKQGCETQYQQLKSQVMSFLVRSEWLNLQAEELGIELTPEKVKAAFDRARSQAFPNLGDYKKYLQNSGQTEADLLYRQRAQMLEEKITEIVNRQAKATSQDEIQEYYERNRSQFTEPAVRTLNVILTPSRSQADKAKSAIEQGEAWDKVADRYSIDPVSKGNGGILAGVSQGTQEKDFDKAIFAAPKNQLQGPLKTVRGYYVFEVTSETPKRIERLDRLQDSIQQIVISEKQQAALRAFGKYYQDHWRKETSCQTGYLVPECSNYNPAAK